MSKLSELYGMRLCLETVQFMLLRGGYEQGLHGAAALQSVQDALKQVRAMYEEELGDDT